MKIKPSISIGSYTLTLELYIGSGYDEYYTANTAANLYGIKGELYMTKEIPR